MLTLLFLGMLLISPPDSSIPGLLVMAHGGSATWNQMVLEAVAPLRKDRPTAVAFGMADPHTLQLALDSLAAQSVRRVVVVRLFIDGASFLHQTEYLLGLRPDPPARFLLHRHGNHSEPHHHGTPAPLQHSLELVLSETGLMEAPEVGPILADRALELSQNPSRESVLLLAHGTEDEVLNARWIVAIERHAQLVRALGFHAVRVETLREDWPRLRAEAERRIRAFVEAETQAGRTVLVVPFRIAGFGPYRQVLTGLSYRAAETGLLPHPALTHWIAREWERLSRKAGWLADVATTVITP
jgi:sirohydrochlorin cobaltochelatase